MISRIHTNVQGVYADWIINIGVTKSISDLIRGCRETMVDCIYALS